jgi:hypothetical protein
MTDDLLAVANIFSQETELPLEEDGAQLSGLIFEGEIAVAGVRAGKIGDLAADPDKAKLSFKQVLD